MNHNDICAIGSRIVELSKQDSISLSTSGLFTATPRHMKQVAPPATHKVGVHATGYVYCHDADDHRPLELVRPREHNRRDIGEQLEQVLESRLDC